MALRPKATLPLPHETLAELQTELPTHYGSCVWEGQGRKILVIRVPGDVPDMIHDLESAVEQVAPAHVKQVDSCVLVGGRKVTGIPLEPLRQLMARRVQLDQEQVTALRAVLPSTVSTRLYRSPDDPKRHLRLGVSLPVEHVADADERDFTELARTLGPAVQERKLDGLHCVYLVGAKDHVRLQPGPFIDDVLQKWEDQERVQRIAEERAAAEKAERIKRIRDKERIMAEIEARRATNVVTAPVTKALAEVDSIVEARPKYEPKYPLPERSEAAPTETSTRRVRTETRSVTRSEYHNPTLDRIRMTVDQMHEPEVDYVEETVETPAAPTRANEPLRSALERNGFHVLENPNVPGHSISAAAERAGAYPQRIIALDANRITRNDAENLLQAARTLDVDMALAIGDAIDNEARSLILASKVKWTRRSELQRLSL